MMNNLGGVGGEEMEKKSHEWTAWTNDDDVEEFG